MRFWLVLCLALLIASCTTQQVAVVPTLRGPIVPTRVIPTNTPTAIPTDTPTATDTPEPTDTSTPVPPTDTPTPTDTIQPSDTPTFTLTPSDTALPPTHTPTLTDTVQPSDTPTFTLTPSDTPLPTFTLTLAPSEIPTVIPTPGEAVPYLNSTSLETVMLTDTLTLGNIVSGSIDDQHPAVLYAFNGTPGMVVAVELRVVEGDLDPFVIVLDPKGREIARNDDYYSTTPDSAILPLTLVEQGTYVIVATRYGQLFGSTTGNFDVAVYVTDPLADKSGTLSQPISYESLINGALDNDVPEQIYAFRATAGDVITVQMTSTSGDLDPRLSLTNNLGTEIIGNDDNLLAATFDAAIQSYIIPRSGYYAIAAQRYSGEENSGSYRLKLTRESQGAAGLYAMLDPINSTTVNDAGAYYINYTAGDELDANRQEHTFQTLLTFRLPPNGDSSIASAEFVMQPCLEHGGGFDTLGVLTIYEDNYGRLNQTRNITRPLPGARVLGTQTSCATLDLTSLVESAYARGETDVQLRLIFRNHADNGNTDQVMFTPRLRITFGG